MSIFTRRRRRDDGRTWDEVMRDLIATHVSNEEEALGAYEAGIDAVEDEGFRYLLAGIVEDERRHHQRLNELAAAVDAMATGARRIRAIPTIHPWEAPERLLEVTEQLLRIERADLDDLDELSRELHDTRWSSIWWIVVEQLRHDTRKHIATLAYLRDLAQRNVDELVSLT